MKILVRLPNWLGDMVMSVGFIKQLPEFFPDAEVSVIAKKGIHELLSFFPPHEHQFIFNKQDYKGMKGLTQFGKEIRATEQFDLFFSLPDSFSSALMGYATRASKRVGYKKELRQFLLTHSFAKPHGLHRAEEYVKLLEYYTGKPSGFIDISLSHSWQKKDYVVVNINSEASSRRLTTGKAKELLDQLRKAIKSPIVLIGAPKEKPFVEEVLGHLENKEGISNMAGATTLIQLAELLASARMVLTTDSGPAHLSNALGTYTIVLFGAGNEANTAPYQKDLCQVIRLGELNCEPCEQNKCVRFGTPQCLEKLHTPMIIQTAKQYLLQ